MILRYGLRTDYNFYFLFMLRNLFWLVSLESTQADNNSLLEGILEVLSSIFARFPRKDTADRQVVNVESFGATIPTVTTVTALNQLGAYQTQLIPFQMSNVWAQYLYDKIDIS